MDNLVVRLAEVKDAPQIAIVHIKTWQCAYRGQLPDSYLDNLSVEQRTKRWEENLNNPLPKTKTFVAELHGKVVGFASAGPCRDDDMSKDTGELLIIYVDPNNMGKGVGSVLLETSLDYLRKLGFEKAALWVLTSNEKTREWYEAKGWKLEGKTKNEIIHGIETHDTRYITDL